MSKSPVFVFQGKIIVWASSFGRFSRAIWKRFFGISPDEVSLSLVFLMYWLTLMVPRVFSALPEVVTLLFAAGVVSFWAIAIPTWISGSPDIFFNFFLLAFCPLFGSSLFVYSLLDDTDFRVVVVLVDSFVVC